MLKKSLKTKVMNFVEIKGGSATHKEIKSFMIREQSGFEMTYEDRGRYCSYFSKCWGGRKATLLNPSIYEKRYLQKGEDKKYYIVNGVLNAR